MINFGVIQGYVTADPVLDHGMIDGKSVVRFVLGSERDFHPGGKGKIYDFISFIAFGKMAELFLKYVQKGQTIIVEYTLHSYNVYQNGVKRSMWKPVVQKVRFHHLRDELFVPDKNNYRESWEEVVYEGFDEQGILAHADLDNGYGDEEPDSEAPLQRDGD